MNFCFRPRMKHFIQLLRLKNEISPSQISPIQLNPFDSDYDDEKYSVSEDDDRRFEDNDHGDILQLTTILASHLTLLF